MSRSLKLRSLGVGYVASAAQTKAIIAIRYFGDRVYFRDSSGRLSRELNAANVAELESKIARDDPAQTVEVLVVDEKPSRAKESLKKNDSDFAIIYGRVLRVEAQKTQKHICDAECRECNHRYFHDFKAGCIMFGLPGGHILLTSESSLAHRICNFLLRGRIHA